MSKSHGYQKKERQNGRRDKNPQRMGIPELRNDFISPAPHLGRGRSWKATSPIAMSQAWGIHDWGGGVAERGAVTFSTIGVLEELELTMSPIEYRFKSLIRPLAPLLTWPPGAHRPLILIGTAYTGNEVQQFRDLAIRARTCGDSHDPMGNTG